MPQRKNIMLGTAGHVDHGKTSLVKLLTGCDTDTLAEEKRRGLTIELGFAPCRLRDERIVGVVDVPGHAGFIRNMVAGAAAIDVVILVVAADDGVMPQTREHLDILTLLGTRGGLVALTKIDLVDTEMRQVAIDDVRSFLRGTFLESAPICPISTITGEGFDDFYDALNDAAQAAQPLPTGGLFRMWIERSFTIHGFGSVASGIPVSGQASVGEKLSLLPSGQTGRVRRLEVYGQDAQTGRAGECLAINLTDIPQPELLRGRLLCAADAFAPATMLQANLVLLGHLPGPLKDYAEVHLHIGTAQATAHVAMLQEKLLQPGQSQLVQLRLAEPLPAAAGDRFVIRAGMAGLADGGVTTLGGGRILSTGTQRLRRARPWIIEGLTARLAALDSPEEWVAVVLAESRQPLSAQALAAQAHVPPEQVQSVLAELAKAGLAIDAGGGKFFHRQAGAALAQPILEALEEFHQANPLRAGMEPGQLETSLQADASLLAAAIEALAAEGKIERYGQLVALAGRKAKLSPREAQLATQIEELYKAAGLASPSLDELAGKLGLSAQRAASLVRLLCEQGLLVQLPEEIVMHAGAVEQARALAIELLRREGGFETVAFRDALGVSRKYAVPLLDHFDAVGLTRRSASRRTPGKKFPSPEKT